MRNSVPTCTFMSTRVGPLRAYVLLGGNRTVRRDISYNRNWGLHWYENALFILPVSKTKPIVTFSGHFRSTRPISFDQWSYIPYPELPSNSSETTIWHPQVWWQTWRGPKEPHHNISLVVFLKLVNWQFYSFEVIPKDLDRHSRQVVHWTTHSIIQPIQQPSNGIFNTFPIAHPLWDGHRSVDLFASIHLHSHFWSYSRMEAKDKTDQGSNP